MKKAELGPPVSKSAKNSLTSSSVDKAAVNENGHLNGQGNGRKLSNQCVMINLFMIVCCLVAVGTACVFMFKMSEDNADYSGRCFQMCQPEDIWEGIRERVSYKV